MSGNRKMPINRVRGFVALVVFLVIGVGIIAHTCWGTLSAMGVGALAYVCPLGALETLVATGAGIPRVLVVLVVAIAAVLLLGKVFCGWVCPVPFVQKIIRPSKKNPHGEERGAPSDKEAIEIGSRNGVRIDSRHFVLLGSLASAAVFGFPVFCLVCPVGLTFAILILLWGLLGYAQVTWSLIVFPVILVLELFVLRRWCHRFCPLGALFSLISIGNNTVVPSVDSKKCLMSSGTPCHACASVCTEHVDPHAKRIPECIKCGACVDACPTSALSFSLLRKSAPTHGGGVSGDDGPRAADE